MPGLHWSLLSNPSKNLLKKDAVPSLSFGGNEESGQKIEINMRVTKHSNRSIMRTGEDASKKILKKYFKCAKNIQDRSYSETGEQQTKPDYREMYENLNIKMYCIIYFTLYYKLIINNNI
ncbi:hypothetical protein NQ317_013216 [Molorchus minor]|uniref:Uncharacterized protein n=1 Tax=Molorchus minor TaxID=1323400 RepID=A0ABQ9IYA8_9CUCU|nr:hypothetical protein NQ317_013216 [Molorchus minor]